MAVADQGQVQIVAIVDDDPSVRGALLGLMKAVEIPAQAFASTEDFLSSGLRRQTACLVADIRMPGMSGLELQAWLNANQFCIPIVFITAHGDDATRAQALSAGAVRFLEKPFDDEELLRVVRRLMLINQGG